MLNRAFLALAVCAGASVAAAQPPERHLIPIDPKLTMFWTLTPYYSSVQDHLLGRSRVGCSVIAFPCRVEDGRGYLRAGE